MTRLWRIFWTAFRERRQPLLWTQKKASPIFDGKDVQTWPVTPKPETKAIVVAFRNRRRA